jgi:hypothetical protein
MFHFTVSLVFLADMSCVFGRHAEFIFNLASLAIYRVKWARWHLQLIMAAFEEGLMSVCLPDGRLYSFRWLSITKSSYFIYWLVNSNTFLWVTRSKVKVTGALNGRMVSAHYFESYLSHSSCFMDWLVITSKWPLLILASLGQRSQGP